MLFKSIKQYPVFFVKQIFFNQFTQLSYSSISPDKSPGDYKLKQNTYMFKSKKTFTNIPLLDTNTSDVCVK